MDYSLIQILLVAVFAFIAAIDQYSFLESLYQPIVSGAVIGAILGPILFLLIFNGVQFGIRYFLMYWSYNLGSNAIDILTKNAKEFTRSASLLGVFIVGALTSNYGATKLAIVIPNGEKPIDIQAILDGVLPNLIPLALTLKMVIFYMIIIF